MGPESTSPFYNFWGRFISHALGHLDFESFLLLLSLVAICLNLPYAVMPGPDLVLKIRSSGAVEIDQNIASSTGFFEYGEAFQYETSGSTFLTLPPQHPGPGVD